MLQHRLPRVNARVLAGEVQAWRARRIAQAVLGAPADVVAYVDAVVARRADQVGAAVLDRLLDEAMLRLHPEERELEQLEALDRRHVTLDERTLNHTGIAEMVIRGDWADLDDFDRALSEVAAALARQGVAESLDVRRTMAVGVLADPARALALLDDEAAPRPRKHTVLYLHLSDLALLGLDPLAHDDRGRPLLEQVVRHWCGRTDTHLNLRPVLDLNAHHDGNGAHGGTEAYAVPDHLKEQVALRDRTCVFPWCTRSARRCDHDHITRSPAVGRPVLATWRRCADIITS